MEATAEGFVFRSGDSGHEVLAAKQVCEAQNVPYRCLQRPVEAPSNWVAVGDVPWCEAVLGRRVMPDYYPDFLRRQVSRRIWRTDKWPIGHRVFIKPADEHKRFTGFVTSGTWKGKKRGPYWCSEIVSFRDEWRYYVTNGQVVAAHWYAGAHGTPRPAPPLAVEWPDDWCGSVDFGETNDGRFELVEAHAPMATGWYGTLAEAETFVAWQTAGWRWLRSQGPR